MEDIKDKIRKALKEKDYTISYEEPNCISEREAIDGSTYLFIRDDDARFGTDAGSCTIEILEYSCTCHLSTGDWEGDEELIEDEEVLDAIKDLDGMYYGEMDDAYQMVEFYCFVNGIKETLEFYYSDSDDMPVDPDEFTFIDDDDNLEHVSYKDEEYIIVEEYEDEPRKVYACHVDESPDAYGKYNCVMLTFNDNNEVIDLKDCDEKYNAVDYFVE